MKDINIKLLSTGNNGFRYRYDFERLKSFKSLLSKFLSGLNFDEKFVREIFLTEDQEHKMIKENICDIKDDVRNYKNNQFDIDVFFGLKNIVVIVRTKSHNELVSVVDKLFKFKGKKK